MRVPDTLKRPGLEGLAPTLPQLPNPEEAMLGISQVREGGKPLISDILNDPFQTVELREEFSKDRNGRDILELTSQDSKVKLVRHQESIEIELQDSTSLRGDDSDTHTKAHFDLITKELHIEGVDANLEDIYSNDFKQSEQIRDLHESRVISSLTTILYSALNDELKIEESGFFRLDRDTIIEDIFSPYNGGDSSIPDAARELKIPESEKEQEMAYQAYLDIHTSQSNKQDRGDNPLGFYITQDNRLRTNGNTAKTSENCVFFQGLGEVPVMRIGFKELAKKLGQYSDNFDAIDGLQNEGYSRVLGGMVQVENREEFEAYKTLSKTYPSIFMNTPIDLKYIGNEIPDKSFVDDLQKAGFYIGQEIHKNNPVFGEAAETLNNLTLGKISY